MSTIIKIVLCLLLPLVVIFTKPVIAEELEIVKPTFEQEMERIFGDKIEIAYAVIQAESSNNYKAINYNCYYNGKSKSCLKEDRSKAWSVDCGVAQINVRGKTCPPQLLTKEGSIPYIEKIYKTQGFNAWVVYKTGAYKKWL